MGNTSYSKVEEKAHIENMLSIMVFYEVFLIVCHLPLYCSRVDGVTCEIQQRDKEDGPP